MTPNDVKLNRNAAEKRADAIAATLPDGDYYASCQFAVDRLTARHTDCGTHWDACLVAMAVNRRRIVA